MQILELDDMKIFTCGEKIEEQMSCIYDAWEAALRLGHEQVRVQKYTESQTSFLDEYVRVEVDVDKAQKVVRTIRNRMGDMAYLYIYYASLSVERDSLQCIYDFVRLGLSVGTDVCRMYQHPVVLRMMELKRKVGNESHHFREFARFTSMNGKVYVCHLEPKSDVIMLVGNHFADRMPSEHWMIIDDNRRTACVHPKDGENYLRYLTKEEYRALATTEMYQDEFTQLWKGFFHAISIKERENYRCQRNMMPIWKRKHAVEFMDEPVQTEDEAVWSEEDVVG